MPSTAISDDAASLPEVTEAEDELYRLPNGRIVEVGGVKYKAFTLDEYKEIARILVSYELMWEQSEILEVQNLSLESEKTLWTKRYDIWKQQCGVERNRGNLYQGLWEREHKLRLNVERTQRLATWVPWTIVVLEAIALAGFGIHQAVGD